MFCVPQWQRLRSIISTTNNIVAGTSTSFMIRSIYSKSIRPRVIGETFLPLGSMIIPPTIFPTTRTIKRYLSNEISPSAALTPKDIEPPDVYGCFGTKDKGEGITPGRNVADLIFVQNHPDYQELFFHYNAKQVEADLIHPAVKNFIALSRTVADKDSPVFHPKYKSEVDVLLASLKELTEIELQYVLYHMRLFSRPIDTDSMKKYAKIWTLLDEECIQRAVARKKWRAQINFVYAHLWDFLLLGRRSTYHWLFVKTCIRKVDTLSREKFVRLCQSIGKSKKLPKDIKLYNLHYNIPRILENSERNRRPITLQELSAICCVFYKMKYPLHDRDVVINMINILISNSKTVSNSSLSAICNGIIINNRLQIQDEVDQLLTVMLPEVPRFDLNSCSSILGLAKQTRVRHPEFLAAVAKHLENLMEDAVLDFEVHHIDWLASAYEDLDTPSSPVFKTILMLMRKYAVTSKRYERSSSVLGDNVESESDEDVAVENNSNSVGGDIGENVTEDAIDELIVQQFHKRLVPILHSIGYGGVYPKNLISKALSSEFFTKTYGKSMHTYPVEILRLDQDVAAELPDYDGPRLSTRVREFLTKANMRWIHSADRLKVPAYELMCRNVNDMVSDIFGDSSHVYLSNVLPHFETIEAVFCTTKSGDVVPVPESFKLKNEYEPKTLLPEDYAGDLQYHVIIMYYWDKLIGSTDEPIGRYSKLKEKVKKMGYKTYEISHNSCNLNDKEKMNSYIRTVLHDVLAKIPNKELKADEMVSLSHG